MPDMYTHCTAAPSKINPFLRRMLYPLGRFSPTIPFAATLPNRQEPLPPGKNSIPLSCHKSTLLLAATRSSHQETTLPATRSNHKPTVSLTAQPPKTNPLTRRIICPLGCSSHFLCRHSIKSPKSNTPLLAKNSFHQVTVLFAPPPPLFRSAPSARHLMGCPAECTERGICMTASQWWRAWR
ncbi:hypothetical protein R5R35_003272 [Gryllus longicercus]|uniref:Uncharacterized protein n=1 Tax=Gryllus longicercus TaxID=2509291 RepID=A0AAN9VQM6_9ORTH